MIRRLFLSILLVVGYVHSAGAETRIEMHAAADPPIVEVGAPFSYQVQALVHDGAMPTDAQPGALPHMSIRGTRQAPVPRMDMTLNGVRSIVTGVVVSWTLVADKEGSFTLGPGSVTASGKTHVAPPVKVKVVARGQAPRRADPLGSPLSPFMGLFDLGTDNARAPPEPQVEPAFGLDAPRADIAFLHATIDKFSAVVGEQVTLTVFMYEDPFAHQGQPTDVHEANTSDFLKRSVSEEDMTTKTLGYANVGGKQWRVKQIRKSALFPFKTGHLAIDPMSLTLSTARIGLRESEKLFVDVSEPPLAGRPPGYGIGDVGDMSLSAILSPRSIQQDGAVGVTVELRGSGNLLEKLPLPVGSGLEWLDVQTNEKLGDAGKGRFGGSRTFQYVLHLHKPGTIDLGDIKVPYWDPAKKSYGVARASLGLVEVKPGSTRDSGLDEAEKLLEGLPAARTQLNGVEPRSFLSERPLYWGFLFGAPALCAIAMATERVARRAHEKKESARAFPERLARDRSDEAESAVRGDDGGAAMGAVARALTAMVLAKTGVNVRGAASDVARRELEDAGVDHADGVLDVLRACEEARFSPDGTSIDEAKRTWERAKSAVAAIERS